MTNIVMVRGAYSVVALTLLGHFIFEKGDVEKMTKLK